jgi:hypothetical protein
MYRHGMKPNRVVRYRLNILEFKKMARNRMYIVSELAGISRDTLKGWLYGSRHRGGQASTTKERAEVLAQYMRQPFEMLWTAVIATITIIVMAQ